MTDELHRAMLDDGLLAGPVSMTKDEWRASPARLARVRAETFGMAQAETPEPTRAYINGLINALRKGSTGPNDVLDRAAHALLDLIHRSKPDSMTSDAIFMAGFDAGMNRARDGAAESHKRIKALEQALAAAANELAAKGMDDLATRSAVVAAGVSETQGEPT